MHAAWMHGVCCRVLHRCMLSAATTPHECVDICLIGCLSSKASSVRRCIACRACAWSSSGAHISGYWHGSSTSRALNPQHVQATLHGAQRLSKHLYAGATLGVITAWTSTPMLLCVTYVRAAALRVGMTPVATPHPAFCKGCPPQDLFRGDLPPSPPHQVVADDVGLLQEQAHVIGQVCLCCKCLILQPR